MKNIILPVILSMLTLGMNAQFWYNKYYENKVLTELSPDELSFLYEKAGQTVRTGTILTIAGSGLTVAGGAIFIYKISHDIGDWHYSGDTFYNITAIGFLSGIVVAAIGIPTIIIGSGRRNDIRIIRNNFNNKETGLQLTPSIIYDKDNRYYPGLNLTITF